MTSAVDCRQASQEYLVDARRELDDGDYPQASEKLWGAAAEMLKAVAETRGWPHKGHAQLVIVIGRLLEETGDAELRLLFRSAGFLHTNFYERWLPPEDVGQAAGEVELLIDKLQGLMEVAA